jgi:hypothetical protein
MQNDININFSDFSHAGRIDGRVSSCKTVDFFNQIDDSFKRSLLNAKSILIEITKNENAEILHTAALLEKLNDFTNNETEFVYTLKESSFVAHEEISYKIIATGL